MNLLYITYDGLTDFIGQSQVMPYLMGCAGQENRLTVISFEKPDRVARIGDQVARQCREAGIFRLPQRFHSNPPIVAKLVDQMAMRRAAFAASEGVRYDLVHCRSYPAAVVGLAVKQRYGTPLLFDMRGFWPDQRREGGRWRPDSVMGRWLYDRWKRHEAQLISSADHIVVLTHAARQEIQTWPSYRNAPISVIPCCTDFNHFAIADPNSAQEARRRLGIPDDAPVLAYLGSAGTVYRIGDHLKLFAAIKARDQRARALFIGRDGVADIMAMAAAAGVNLDPNDMFVVAAERGDVPYWLGAADVASCFIIPGYSSKGVSPTKLAEYLACGIPVIANRSVGDVDQIIHRLDAGHVMPDFECLSMDAAAEAFLSLQHSDRPALRQRARPFDISHAIDAYRSIYRDPATAVQVGLK